MSLERRLTLSCAFSGLPLLLVLAGVRAAVADTCSFQLAADNAPFVAIGGTGAISVNTVGDGCAWAASSNVDWVAVQPGTLSSARITFSGQPNSGSAPRTGTIQVAGNLVQLVQTGSSFWMPFQDVDPTSPDADYVLLAPPPLPGPYSASNELPLVGLPPRVRAQRERRQCDGYGDSNWVTGGHCQPRQYSSTTMQQLMLLQFGLHGMVIHADMLLCFTSD